jgi:succinate dehydrogenase/fumarate reductase cytochrome b subunit
LLTTEGSFFAEADRRESGLRNALTNQILLHGVRAAVPKRQVVFLAAFLIAVAFNCEFQIRILFQECGCRFELRDLVRGDLK